MSLYEIYFVIVLAIGLATLAVVLIETRKLLSGEYDRNRQIGYHLFRLVDEDLEPTGHSQE